LLFGEQDFGFTGKELDLMFQETLRGFGDADDDSGIFLDDLDASDCAGGGEIMFEDKFFGFLWDEEQDANGPDSKKVKYDDSYVYNSDDSKSTDGITGTHPGPQSPPNKKNPKLKPIRRTNAANWKSFKR
jgi:hypothetical protein